MPWHAAIVHQTKLINKKKDLLQAEDEMQLSEWQKKLRYWICNYRLHHFLQFLHHFTLHHFYIWF